MNLDELNKVAEAMVAPGRGILAADESNGTIKKRFDTLGVESTEDTRRDYREMLFRTKDAMSKYISGVILYDETIRQKAKDGTPLVQIITQAGALPGIKVDKGTKPLPNCPGRSRSPRASMGLRERLAEYRGLGAKFAKWRAVIDIGRAGAELHLPAHQRARARAICRTLPGRRHRADRRAGSADGRRSRYRALLSGDGVALKPSFEELYFQRVALEGMVLKPNMVVPGKNRARKRQSKRLRRRRCACSKPACRPRSPASPSFPAVNPTRTRLRISTPSTEWATCPGTSHSPMAARCKPHRRKRGRENPRTWLRHSAHSITAPR